MKQKNINKFYYRDPLQYKGYLQYLTSHLNYLSVKLGIRGIYIFLKKYLFLGKIIKFVRFIFIWVQTSTYLIFFSAFFLFLIPLFILVFLILFLFSVCRHKRSNRLFAHLIKDHNFLIYFSDIPQNMAKESDGKNTVFITVVKNPVAMLPYAIKKHDGDHYIISLSYFYDLKKHILDTNTEKVKYEGEK